ncbi:MAG: LysM peptidoglycan-binding domain-containing protein [Chloroflexi bacterium]|nr:LysM peptidoglycan-binding domain-containing protein [Chloroflexota bacterium]
MFARFTIFLFVFAAALLVVMPQPALTQTGGDTCPAVVEQALAQLGDNCASLERNSACYGFNRIEATFVESVPADFFTRPADRTALVTLASLRTSPLDTDSGEWGMAVIKAQANVPDTLPGQAVTFLLLGDTEVENAVEPAAAAGQSISIITQADTTARSEPSESGQIIAALPAGSVLQADALSTDGQWLRVQTPAGLVWIPRQAVNQTDTLDSLPAEDAARLTPMQAFYFRTAPGQTTCNQAPSVLAIQSPEGISVDLTVNGANIRLGSLIVLRTLPPGNIMQITVISGQVILNPGTPDEIIIPAGYTSTHCLADPDNLGIDGESDNQPVGEDCDWTEPTPASPEDQAEWASILAAYAELGLGEDIIVIDDDTCETGATLVHTVVTGENLYRIARRYQSSVQAIVEASGISNPALIFTGQQLIIPCGVDTGLPSVVPTGLPQTNEPPPPLGVSGSAGVDCSNFAATSPLDGLAYGPTTFYWNPAPGATGYRVNIFNVGEQNGALVASFTTDGNSYNLTAELNVDNTGYGFSFAWNVEALGADGQPACVSQQVFVPREAPPAPPTPAPTPVPTPESTPN